MKSVEQMTKKERKAHYAKQRNTWTMNPITRREDKNKWKEKKLHEKAKYDRAAF